MNTWKLNVTLQEFCRLQDAITLECPLQGQSIVDREPSVLADWAEADRIAKVIHRLTGEDVRALLPCAVQFVVVADITGPRLSKLDG